MYNFIDISLVDYSATAKLLIGVAIILFVNSVWNIWRVRLVCCS